MSQGGYAEIVGFVAREPSLKQINGGPWVANLRVGATTRFLDKGTGEWRESDTSYFTVICWRKLAHNADLSLRKGDPVLVRGRLRTRSFTDKQGRLRAEVEIVADHIGHDLSRGTARYTRRERPRDQVDGELTDAPLSLVTATRKILVTTGCWRARERSRSAGPERAGPSTRMRSIASPGGCLMTGPWRGNSPTRSWRPRCRSRARRASRTSGAAETVISLGFRASRPDNAAHRVHSPSYYHEVRTERMRLTA
jgi:single-strand DNA-binding protein